MRNPERRQAIHRRIHTAFAIGLHIGSLSRATWAVQVQS